MRSRSCCRSQLSLPLLVAFLLSAGAAGAQVIVPNLIYTTVVPCRKLDTRLSTAGRLAAGVVRTFNIVGNATGTYFTDQGGPSGGCSVPGFVAFPSGEAAPRRGQSPAATVQGPAQVQAVVINLAVVNASGPGYLNAWPTDHGLPFTSLINYTFATTVANQVVLAVRQDTPGADISVIAAVSGTHLIGDIVGYFSASSVTPTSGYGNLFVGPASGNTGSSASTGVYNVGLGQSAMAALTHGTGNVAVGAGALGLGTIAQSNVAVGSGALSNLTTGTANLAVGVSAGSGLTSNEESNIDIGNTGVAGDFDAIRIGTDGMQHSAYIAGVSGVTSPTGTAVYISNNGQLGTLISSLRFKEEVEEMGDLSRGLMRLRPVAFHYKPAYDDGSHLLQYGLIAEEVAKVYPDLVQVDPSGKPLAVRTHFINAMMLNEVQRQHRTITAQQARIDEQQAEIAELQRQVRALLQQRQPGGTD
jgi:hypothetical protein